VINTNWHPISYRLQVIADYCSHFGHFYVFEPPFAEIRNNVHCSS